jgi:predicted Zn-dependent peptidase
LDAVLTGATGLNLWTSARTPPPQRRARLYTALVDAGLAAAVGGSLTPTAHPFLHTISATAADRTPLAALEQALVAALGRVLRDGVAEDEVQRAKRQLQARFVFENDSVTAIAHQLGYFETIGSWRMFGDMPRLVDAVTREAVNQVAAARLAPQGRTIGWFDPQPE